MELLKEKLDNPEIKILKHFELAEGIL